MVLAGSQDFDVPTVHRGGCRLGIMVDIVKIVTPCCLNTPRRSKIQDLLRSAKKSKKNWKNKTTPVLCQKMNNRAGFTDMIMKLLVLETEIKMLRRFQ